MNRAGRFFWIVFLLLAPQVVPRCASGRPPRRRAWHGPSPWRPRPGHDQSRLDELL